MTTSRTVTLGIVLAISACALPVLGYLFLNETFFHGFPANCADGYPQDAADEAACAPSWGAGLPYLVGLLIVAAAAGGALWQLFGSRRGAPAASPARL